MPSIRAAIRLSVLILPLLLSACGHMPRVPQMLGGSPDVELRLDGEQTHQAETAAGHALVLDMRDPGSSGYTFAGAAFDTDLFRLELIEPSGGRVRYTFRALKPGEGEIAIKITRKEPGYKPDVFKRVRVTVTP